MPRKYETEEKTTTKEGKRDYMREYMRARRQTLKETKQTAQKKVSEASRETMALYESYSREVDKWVQRDIAEQRARFTPWHDRWNQELKNQLAEITQGTSTCPYCDKLRPIKGPEYHRWIAVSEHVQDYHPEKYRGYQRNRHMNEIDRLRKWSKDAKEKQQLKEQLTTMNGLALQAIRLAESFLALNQELRELAAVQDAVLKNQNVITENLAARVKGQFRGQQKKLGLTETTDKEFIDDPKRSGKK